MNRTYTMMIPQIVSCMLIAFLSFLGSSFVFSPVHSKRPDFEKYDKDPNKRFVFIQDGKYSKELNIPTYEWKPKDFDEDPRGTIIFVHGLTLHGKRYELSGKAFAASNYNAISFDMRGFGRCFYDPDNKFSISKDPKKKVDYKKSFSDLVKLAKLVKSDYPELPIVMAGESLGATPCLKLAAEYPELVDAIILSGPAIGVNPLMLFHPRSVVAGLRGLLIDPMFNVKLKFFMDGLVSSDPDIVEEIESDPLMRKKMTIRDLLKTDRFVSKNLKYARKLKRDLPILILQGSKDKCVIPKEVVKLCSSIHSNDQTLRWMDSLSHLLLETKHVKPATVDAISTFMYQHEEERQKEWETVKSELKQLGADKL